MLTSAEIKRRVPIEAVVAYYGGSLDPKGKGRCLMPQHHHNGDANPSMTVKDGRVKCWSQECFGEKGADVFELVGVMESLSSFVDRKRRACEIGNIAEAENEPRRIVATYDYTDESGVRLFQVLRYNPKGFAQRRPDGQGGWVWNLNNARLVVYHLSDVIKATNVLIVEGEKDVATAYARGLPEGWAATCNPMGAGKWRKEYSEVLRGKRVVIVPDADEPGWKHADRVAQSLEGVATEIMMAVLPEGCKDLTDWTMLKHGEAPLNDLLNTARPWTSSDATEPKLRNGVILVRADSIRPEPVNWAWESRIPLGMLTIVAGDPGLGKSTITMHLAARWTRGNVEGGLNGNPVAVAIASAEDSSSATMVPRLIAAGADLSRIHFVRINRDGISDGVSFPDDVRALLERIQEVGAKVLIIDPLMAHLASSVNAHRDQHIRRALAPLARMAEELDVAIPVVVHLNKDEQKSVLARVGGSIGIVAAARSLLLAAPDPSDPDNGLRMLAHAKCNVGPHAPTLCYRIVSQQVNNEGATMETSRVQWEGEAPTMVAADLLVRLDRSETGDQAEVQEWLKDYLADGPKPSQPLLQEGKKEGFSASTMKRAKKRLTVESLKIGFGKESHWCWQLPEAGQPSAKESQAPGSDPLREKTRNDGPFGAGSCKEGQRCSLDPLKDRTDSLCSPYTVGTRIRFQGGLGFLETGIIKAVREWSAYPGQVCYEMDNGRTFPHERVIGIVEGEE